MSGGKRTVYKLVLVCAVFGAVFNCQPSPIAATGFRGPSNDQASQKTKENADSVVLFPIYDAGLVGYIDKAGRVVIPPMFHNAKRFSEGLARVEIDGKWGFIDKTGAVVIKPQFELVSTALNQDSSIDLDFNEGMAVVGRVEDPGRLTEKWGYINKTGRVIIPFQYDSAGRFSEGLAAIGERYIEKEGNLITDGGRSLGYLDKTGKIVLRPRAESWAFTEGLALAVINPFTDDKKEGYIAKSGKFIIEPRAWEAYSFCNGFARVRKAHSFEWGFIDKTGKVVVSMIYDDAKDFNEGLAAVKKNDRWGFIDKNGTIKINPQYLAVGNFSEGVASACIEDQKKHLPVCGYIDPQGNWLIPPAFFVIVSDFRNGLAFVFGYDTAGYINTQGEFVWKIKQPADKNQKNDWTVNGCSILSQNREYDYPCKL